MNIFTFIYLSSPKRVFEKMIKGEEGKKQQMKARQILLNNPKPEYNLDEVLTQFTNHK